MVYKNLLSEFDMKKLKIYLAFLALIITSSCSNNSKDGDINPLGPNLGGNDNVTITIGIITGQYDLNQDGNLDEVVIFTASPNVAVKITKVTYSLPSQQINDSYTSDGKTEYAANKPEEILIAGKSQIATGQQWVFQFEGIISANNQSFNVTSNFTVPDGFGGTIGGGNNNVTITIGTVVEQQDVDNDGNPDEVLYFTGTPNINIKLNKVIASVPAQQYIESFNFDGTTEYQANTSAKLIGYLKNVITSGQQWTFQFEGTVASNNQTFNITSNYTIP